MSPHHHNSPPDRIIPFPGRASLVVRPAPESPSPLRPIANPRREYSFADVTRLLALAGEARTRIGYLRDLARQCAMPLPRNPRRFRGTMQTGPAVIGSKSRWCALEFDAWLDGQRTPPPAAASSNPVGSPGGVGGEAGAGGRAARSPAPVLHADMRARARRLAAGAA